MSLDDIVERSLPAQRAERYLLRERAVLTRDARLRKRGDERRGISALRSDPAQYVERGAAGRAYKSIGSGESGKLGLLIQ
jgi:hypothetical protein